MIKKTTIIIKTLDAESVMNVIKLYYLLTFTWCIFVRFLYKFPNHYLCRLWDIECGTCLRVLEGHEELVRCIRFDSKRIVSGAYDGKIKVWDLLAALDPRVPANSLCLKTLVVSI